jgi:hypothetical protein
MKGASQYSPLAMTTAASAPAPPATMKLGPLQRKLSRQTRQTDCRAASAIAPATSPVLTRKYVAIVAMSGFVRSANDVGAGMPPVE